MCCLISIKKQKNQEIFLYALQTLVTIASVYVILLMIMGRLTGAD